LRATLKRRQLYRRITIVVAVVAILVVLVVGFYLAELESTANDARIGDPVNAFDLAALHRLSIPPYGQPPSSADLKAVTDYSGQAWTGKPLVVFIGADFCPYCAAERWPVILAFMRFGNFTGLKYMTSRPSEGDYATFTFSNMSYTSKYVNFEAYEARDRSDNPYQTVPSNYSSVWSQYGEGFPFMDFGNKFIISGSLIDPSILIWGNWVQLEDAIGNGTTTGTAITEAANLVTALVCKLTGSQPSSVCDQNPINDVTSLLVYTNSSPGGVSQPLAQAYTAISGASPGRRDFD
jgi:thiol-disulfide isomerase/thioredoxin